MSRKRGLETSSEVRTDVLFYPRFAPFPTAITIDTPALKYGTRRGAVKSTLHWGQRKLFLSELQLLTEALETAPGAAFTVVYAGAAPGTHLAHLDRMFPGHEWHLIDPVPFDTNVLEPLPNFKLIRGYFTNQTAYEYVAQQLANGSPALSFLYRHEYRVDADPFVLPSVEGNQLAHGGVASLEDEPLTVRFHGLLALQRAACRNTKSHLLFICDIRSGSASFDEEADEPRSVAFEGAVRKDMTQQMYWVESLEPTFALLKFRLPYSEVYNPITKEVMHRHPEPTVPYLRGTLLLPIWTRPTSTECRLLVPRGAQRVPYNIKIYEDQCFFFNSVVRERMHFWHPIEGCRNSNLDHRYDGAAEVHWLLRFIAIEAEAKGDTAVVEMARAAAFKGGQGLSNAQMLDLSQRVLAHSAALSESLGKTFHEAAMRLPRILMEKAVKGGFARAQERLLADAERHRGRDEFWEREPAAAMGSHTVAAGQYDPWAAARDASVR